MVALLCDTTPLQGSQSLVASVLLGRDNWDMAAAGDSDSKTQRLRNAVVNLLVCVVGSPNNHHLMVLLLEPLALKDSYPVGFIYGLCPGPEGYHFDCGCVLDDHGRPVGHGVRNRAPLQNIHLHWINFCSWAMLSVGLLVFPQNCDTIDQILTLDKVREVNPRVRGASSLADMARSFAMNYAMRCFECVCSCQGLTEEDRSLAFTRLFCNFRMRAVARPPEFHRTFATAAAREAYEEIWRSIIDNDLIAALPELGREALRVSKAQAQLVRLQEFRASLSYLHKFFCSFRACTAALPWEPEFAFVAALVNRQEELAHLPLLGHFVQIQNWIGDRLNGLVPAKCLDQPLFALLQLREQTDDKMESRSNARHCQVTRASLERFIQGWKKFHEANHGQIPVECQARLQWQETSTSTS